MVTSRNVNREPVAGNRRAATPRHLDDRFAAIACAPVSFELPDVKRSTGGRLVSGYRLQASGYRLSRGFSLIELVAVLVLIALVFSLVTLSFSKSLASAKIQAASRDLVAALRFTRGQAIVKGKSTSLELDVENNRYMTPGRRVVALPPNMRMTLLTADNEVTGANSGRIRFFPDGASTGGHISVFMGKDEWRINVDWLTGAVTREELKK
jgi:general secretion pathway protein H